MRKVPGLRLALAGLALGLPGAAHAADAPTVESLLAQGYAVAGVVPSGIGPGLFLQKGPSLFACFVSETADSPALKTRYCKPVQ